MKLSGIDYSLTSPAICVFEGDAWSIDNCKFHYLVKKKDLLLNNKSFKGTLYPDWSIDQERYKNLSDWALDAVSNSDFVSIEGYAFGAVGRVFNLAENGGLLKQTLWSSGIKFSVPAPSEIKKFATGKGNAGKDLMFESFYKETNLDMFDVLSIKNRNNWNPVSDIIDAYYICKLQHSKVYKV